jgi:hypothetical protein
MTSNKVIILNGEVLEFIAESITLPLHVLCEMGINHHAKYSKGMNADRKTISFVNYFVSSLICLRK